LAYDRGPSSWIKVVEDFPMKGNFMGYQYGPVKNVIFASLNSFKFHRFLDHMSAKSFLGRLLEPVKSQFMETA
jgi:hypothetical protein